MVQLANKAAPNDSKRKNEGTATNIESANLELTVVDGKGGSFVGPAVPSIRAGKAAHTPEKEGAREGERDQVGNEKECGGGGVSAEPDAESQANLSQAELQAKFPVGSGARGKPAVGKRLNQDQRDWLNRRVKGLHTGVPGRSYDETRLGELVPMFTKQQDPEGPLGVAGNFGQIFKSTHSEGKAVIVKKCKVSRSQRFEDILLEICMHEVVCQHESLVGYYGAFSHENCVPREYAMVLEAYDKSLDAWLHYGPSDRLTSEALTSSLVMATTGLIEAVRFLHSLGRLGVMHRDIKPANLLVKCERDGALQKVALTDLGFSCVPGSDHACPGTPRYMSPELCSESPHGLPADVWAVGVTLVEMWTGMPPMQGLSDDECGDRILAEFFPPDSLGPAFEERKENLDRFPAVKAAVGRCFLAQNERATIGDRAFTAIMGSTEML